MTSESKKAENEKTVSGHLKRGVRRYILDLSNVKPDDLPERFKGGPMRIPMVEGQYENDYDVVMEELPPKFAKEWKSYSVKKKPAMRQDWPLGVSDHHLDRCLGAIVLDA